MFIDKIIEKSILNKSIVLLAFIITLFVSFFNVKNIKIDAIPDLSDTQVIVKTTFNGQNPKIIEEQVTNPLSTILMSVPKTKVVRGYSYFNHSYIYVIFEDNTDIYWARTRVLEYLNQNKNKLPSNAKTELGSDASGVGWIYQYALIDKKNKTDLQEMTSLQNWYIKKELQSIKGISEVATVGGKKLSYEIVLKPEKLFQYNLDIKTIKDSISNNNEEVGGSLLEMSEYEYMIRSGSYLNNIEDIKNTPIKIIKETNTPIYIKDIAEVRKSSQKRRGIAELNGEGEVVGGIVIMRQGENAITVINEVKKKLEKIKTSLPEDIEIIETYDRSPLINKSIENLKDKIIEEIIVVALICLIFLLHIRSTIIAAVILPVSILISLGILSFLNIPLNIMSLGGIAIAIGTLIDGAIVLIENFHKNREKNNKLKHWDLVLLSTKEVGKPIFLSLLIIIVSFLPIFFLEGQESKLFEPLAITKTLIMIVSMILSITLIPILIGFFIKGKVKKEKNNILSKILIGIYKPILNICLKFPKITIMFSLIIMTSIYYPLSNLKTEFMPELEEGDLLYMPTTLPSISETKAKQLLQQSNKLIKEIPEVDVVFGKIGRAETSTDPAPLTMIETTIKLKNKSLWRKGYDLNKIIEELDNNVNIPSLTNAWVQPIKTRIDMLSTGIKTKIGIKLSGNNIQTLQDFGIEIEKELNKLPETKNIYSERVAGGKYIDIKPKKETFARYGLTQKDIQEIVKYAIGGLSIGNIIQGEERYQIHLRYPRSIRDNIEKLNKLPIATKEGYYISLGNIADIFINEGAPMIKSENGRLISWLYINTSNVDTLKYIEKANKIISEKIKIPLKHTYSFSGEYENIQSMQESMKLIIPITLLSIFILLIMIFNSTIQATIVMTTLPFALIGSFWYIYVLEFKFSIAVLVGLIALLGLAAEFGVIMLTYLNKYIDSAKKQENYNIEKLKDSIIEGAVLRIRPKAMTVLTIFLGLMPIMYGQGVGNEIMQKIAAPMIGGMLTAPLLSLFILPVMVFLYEKRKIN